MRWGRQAVGLNKWTRQAGREDDCEREVTDVETGRWASWMSKAGRLDGHAREQGSRTRRMCVSRNVAPAWSPLLVPSSPQPLARFCLKPLWVLAQSGVTLSLGNDDRDPLARRRTQQEEWASKTSKTNVRDRRTRWASEIGKRDEGRDGLGARVGNSKRAGKVGLSTSKESLTRSWPAVVSLSLLPV